MSNDAKRTQSLVVAVVRDEHRPTPGGRAPEGGGAVPAWLTLAALLLALLGLAALLPPPTELLTLSGRGAAAVDAIVMAGAALVVWALAFWVACVAMVAACGVLPGTCGRQARRLLGLIAPRLALRLVAVAVGASALAGTTACSAPIFASTSSPAATSTAAPAGGPSVQVADPAAASLPAPGSGPSADLDPDGSPALVIDIDWPADTAGTQATATPAPALTPDSSPAESVSPQLTSAASTTAAPTTAAPMSSAPPSATTDRPPATTSSAAQPADPAASTPSTIGSTTPAAALPTADAAGGSTGPFADRAAPATRPSGEAIVVRPGDTLWSLAADALPADADDVAVDAAWRQWYALNRDVVGDDPDLLLPGEHLTPPPADPPTVEENDR